MLHSRVGSRSRLARDKCSSLLRKLIKSKKVIDHLVSLLRRVVIRRALFPVADQVQVDLGQVLLGLLTDLASTS
jgi:hypothetical protein